MQAGQKAQIAYKILVGKAPKKEIRFITNIHIVQNAKEIREVMHRILH